MLTYYLRPSAFCLALAVLMPGAAFTLAPSLGAQDWTQVLSTGPGARAAPAMVFDPALGESVLFGGFSGSPHGDTWSWNGLRWLQLAPAASPSARWHHAMVLDPVRGRIVLFGGMSVVNTSTYQGDTWEWDGANWQQVGQASPAPSSRIWHAMAFDAVGSQTLLFGGYDGGVRDDTWAWSGTTWTQHQPAINPLPRTSPTMVTNMARGVVTLFGGASGTGPYLNDTWEWDGYAWTERSMQVAPTGRSSHAMCQLPASDSAFLFGGGTPAPLNDTWVLQSGQWQPLNTTTTPPARNWTAMTFDPLRSSLVMFGGEGGSAQWLGDTWECPLAATTASASVFGSGCSGSNGVPTLAPSNLPILGSVFAIAGSNLPTPAINLAIGFFGFSRTSWGFYTLPFDLSGQGLPGCNLLVAPPPPGIILSTFTANGQCSWAQALPNATYLAGLELFFQALIPDAQAGNPLGASVSNGVVARIGW